MGRYSPTVLPTGTSVLATALEGFGEGYEADRERRRRRKLDEEERGRREKQDERQAANDARLNDIFEMEYPEVGQPAARPTMESQIPPGLEGLGELFEPESANIGGFREEPEQGEGDDLFSGLSGGMPPRLPKPALPGAFVPGVGFNLAPAGASTYGRSMRVPRRELVARQQQEEGRAREETERSELEEVLAALEHISPEQARALSRGGSAAAVMQDEDDNPPKTRETDRGIEEFVGGAWKPTGRRPYERPREPDQINWQSVTGEDGKLYQVNPRTGQTRVIEGVTPRRSTGTGDVTRKRQYDRAVNSLKQQFNTRWNAAKSEEDNDGADLIQQEFNTARANLAAEFDDDLWQPGGGNAPAGRREGGGAPANNDASRARARAQALQRAGKSRDEILNTLKAEGFNVQ